MKHGLKLDFSIVYLKALVPCGACPLMKVNMTSSNKTIFTSLRRATMMGGGIHDKDYFVVDNCGEV
jgi:hypothetical protein